MKRRVIEMLNLQVDSFSNRETKVRWVDWENRNVSHGQNKLRFNPGQEQVLTIARRFRYED